MIFALMAAAPVLPTKVAASHESQGLRARAR